MNKNGSIIESLRDFGSTFNSGGGNSDITQHYSKKTVDKITRNKDHSKTKITERKIDDKD